MNAPTTLFLYGLPSSILERRLPEALSSVHGVHAVELLSTDRDGEIEFVARIEIDPSAYGRVRTKLELTFVGIKISSHPLRAGAMQRIAPLAVYGREKTCRE